MRRSLVGIASVALGVSIAASALAEAAPAATASTSTKNVREERPTVVHRQIRGRGLRDPATSHRYFAKWIGAGIGAMGFATNGAGFGMVPVYLSLNPVGDEHSLYISPGVLFAFGSVSGVNSTLSNVLGTAEIGWQMQLRSGFMMRVGVDFLFGSGGFIIWPGITLGGNF
jgi:hypothetical protein